MEGTHMADCSATTATAGGNPNSATGVHRRKPARSLSSTAIVDRFRANSTGQTSGIHPAYAKAILGPK